MTKSTEEQRRRRVEAEKCRFFKKGGNPRSECIHFHGLEGRERCDILEGVAANYQSCRVYADHMNER